MNNKNPKIEIPKIIMIKKSYCFDLFNIFLPIINLLIITIVLIKSDSFNCIKLKQMREYMGMETGIKN